MNNFTTTNKQTIQSAANLPSEQRWSIRALAWLLLLQAIILFGGGIYHSIQAQVLPRFAHLSQLTMAKVLIGLTNSIIFGWILIPLAILVFMAAIGFFRNWQIAWLNAMLSEGLILTISIWLYFSGIPDYVAMVSSTLLVIYLNYVDEQTHLLEKSLIAEEGNIDNV